MPHKPRANWAAILARILERVASEEVYSASWRESLLGQTVSGRFAIEAVHVFGSFARGAEACGDLDLVVNVKAIEGPFPPSTVVTGVALGRPRHVDVLVDNAGSDHFLSQFSEARLVWSRKSTDWRANVAAIPVDESAARFARKTDALPVALRTLNASREEAEALVDRINSHEIISTFVPFDSLRADATALDDRQAHLVRCAGMGVGAATQKLVPRTMHHAINITSEPYSLRFESRRGWFHINEVAIRMGRPNIDVSVLDRVDAGILLLVPHLRSGATPGIWRVERGPQHPVVKAFENVQLWLLGRDGAPSIVGVEETGHGTYWQLEWTLDMYTHRSLAECAIRDWADDHEVLQIGGGALLQTICRCDQIFLDDEVISTHQAATTFLAALRRARPRAAKRSSGTPA